MVSLTILSPNCFSVGPISSRVKVFIKNNALGNVIFYRYNKDIILSL